MTDLLFDTPWWLLTVIGVVGAALLMSGNSRRNRQLLLGGLCTIGLGMLLATVSWLVDTPREKVINGTRALVSAAVTRDGQRIGTYLHPNASLGRWNRQQIIDGAPEYAERFGLKGATISGMEVTPEPGMFRVTMRVFSTHESRNLPYQTASTDWRLEWWEGSGGQWQLKTITPMGTGDLSGERMSKQFFGAP